MKEKDTRHSRKYLIDLVERHSVVALIAGIMVFGITVASIIIWIDGYDHVSEEPLHYFTALSNMMSALAAAFMIPYAIEGIRKKHFVLPRYIVLFQFSGATCVSITMLTALCIILPLQGSDAVTGTNFWLHVVTPLFAVILFQCVETGTTISRRSAIFSLIPFWAYIIVYFIMVVIIGEENGGWSDIYMTQHYFPVWVTLILFLVFGFVMALVMRAIHNYRAKQFWKRVSALWTDDMMPEEMLVEAMGLGRCVGKRENTDVELAIPMNIFMRMSERFDIPIQRLINAYVFGVLDSKKEKKN